MNFNIEKARSAGKSDSEIADYLAQKSGFNIEKARSAGKSDSEIADYLSKSKTPKKPPPSWGDVLKGIPKSVGVEMANLASSVAPTPSNIYNWTASLAEPIGQAVSGEKLDLPRLHSPRFEDDPVPENMTGTQSATRKGLKFAAESAIPFGGGPAGPIVKAGANAALGFASGAAGDVVGRETQSPWAELATNVATPLGVATLAKTAPGLIHAGANTAAIVGPTTDRGLNRIAKDTVGRAAGMSPQGDQAAIRDALVAGESYVPGVNPSVADSLVQAQVTNRGAPQLGGGLVALERDLATADPYQSLVRMKSDLTARTVEDMAGGGTAAERRVGTDAIRAEQRKVVEPLFRDAEHKANQGQQFLQRVKQLGQLNNTVFANVPSLQSKPLFSRFQSLLDDVKSDDLSRKITTETRTEIARAVDKATGTIPAEKLSSVRSKLNERIDRLLGTDAPPKSKKRAAGVAGDLKKMIDDAMDQAGAGNEWEVALKTHGEYARRLQRMEALDLLARSVKPVDGRVKPQEFLNWTGDDEAKLLKKIGASENLTSLEQLLGPDDYQRLMGVRKQLLREDLARGLKVGGNTTEIDKAPKAINVLNPKIAALNWLMKFSSKTKKAEVLNRLSEVMQDPKKVAAMLGEGGGPSTANIPFDLRQQSLPILMQYPANQLSATLETE